MDQLPSLDAIDLCVPTLQWSPDPSPHPPSKGVGEPVEGGGAVVGLPLDWSSILISLNFIRQSVQVSQPMALSLDEAGQVAIWLREGVERAIAARKGLPSTVVPQARVVLLARSGMDAVAGQRAMMLGAFFGDPDDREADSVVDVARDDQEDLWVRLIAPGELAWVAWLSDGAAEALAEGLERAIEEVEERPPRPYADHTLGSASGVGSSGQGVSLRVYVETMVADAEAPRLAVDYLGTWWIDPEALMLIGALEQAASVGSGPDVCALSLRERREEFQEPWLQVWSRQGSGGGRQVELRLFDELVAEDGEDGIALLSAGEAGALARMLREALAWRDENPARVYEAPEPFERVAVRVELG